MKPETISIRNAKPEEFAEIGALLTKIYSQLEGFPTPAQQPGYYRMLANVGEFTTKPETEILVAVEADKILGAVIYFGDMQYYGSGGSAVDEINSAGFRLLGVSNEARGKGVGKLLINACIDKAKKSNREQVIIHSTKAMKTAWKIYEEMGFERSEELDFEQGDLHVFGFRLSLQ